MTRASLASTSVLFLYLVAACENAERAEVGPGPSAPASSNSRPVATTDRPSEARCNEVRECLRSKLSLPSKEFTIDPYSEAIGACLGRDSFAIASVGACAPVRVALDPQAKRQLEVFVTCSDVCPDQTRAGVRYVDVSEDECACLGGSPIFVSSYVGCAPHAGGIGYERRHVSFRSEMHDGSPRLAVERTPIGSIPQYYRFARGDVVDSIDGKRVRDRVLLHRLVHTWPERAPNTMRLFRGSATAEIRYVSEPLLRKLEQLMDETHVFDDPTPSRDYNRLRHPEWPRLVAGARIRSWDPAKADAETRRLERVAAQVIRVASSSRRSADGSSGGVDCHAMRDALTYVAVIRPRRSLELAYIDWIGSGAGSGSSDGTLHPVPGRIPRNAGATCASAKPATMVAMPRGFYIDSTEVSRCHYATWLAMNPPTSSQAPWCSWNRDYTPRCKWPPGVEGDHPVVCVDWCDAFAYCKANGKRLCGGIGGGPTDYMQVGDTSKSQWTAACRAGGPLPFPYGDEYEPQTCNGRDHPSAGCASGSCTTVPVGSLPECQTISPGAGVFDLSGNVPELEDACNGTTGSNDHCRTRGGGYRGFGGVLKCDFYDGVGRSQTSEYLGFRCCSDP